MRAMLPAICDGCGIPIMARAYKVRRQKSGEFIRLSCSKSCAGKISAASENRPSMKGALNPNWRGGVSNNAYGYKKKSVARYPEKNRARMKLAAAIRNGKLSRGPCEKCGSRVDVHGHHHDYSKPLDVVWLCRPHHREVHLTA